VCIEFKIKILKKIITAKSMWWQWRIYGYFDIKSRSRKWANAISQGIIKKGNVFIEKVTGLFFAGSFSGAWSIQIYVCDLRSLI